MLTRSKTKGKTGTRWKRRGRKRGDVNSNRRRSPHLRASTIIDSPRSLRKVQATDDFSALNVFCPTGEGGGVDPTCPLHVSPSVVREAIEKCKGDVCQVGVELAKQYHSSEEEFGDIWGGAQEMFDQETMEGKPYTLKEEKHEEYIKKLLGHYSSGRFRGRGKLLGNASPRSPARSRPSRPNPLRVDPTRTSGVRRRFSADLKRRLAALKAAIRRFLVTDDELGLAANVFCPTGEGGGIDPSCSPGGGSDLGKQELVLYRVADDDSFGDTASFSEARSDAEFYKNNPGFGGTNLYRSKVTVDLSKSIDLTESNDAIGDLAKLVDRDVPKSGDFEYGRREDELVPLWHSELADKGVEWVRVRESNPPDAITWIWTGAGDEPNMKQVRADDAVANAFCPTGPGGGQDNSCSSSGTMSDDQKLAHDNLEQLKGLPRQRDSLIITEPVATPFPFVKQPYRLVAGQADEHGEVDKVKLEDLLATQSAVDRGVVHGMIEKQFEEANVLVELPVIVKYGGKLYIEDGHHRLAAVKMIGRKSVVVKLLDLDRPLVANAQTFRFSSSPEKLAAFRRWLAAQMKLQGLLFTEQRTGERQWWERYIREVWQQGQARAYDEVNRSKKVKSEMRDYYKDYAEREPGGKYRTAKGDYKTEKSTDDFYAHGKEQFLRDSFQRPVSVERVQQMASRTFTDLKGFSDDMATRINRTLTDGLIKGQSPRETAKEIEAQLDISESRALMIARTETIRALNEGALDAMERSGVERVGVAVEWSVSGLGETSLGNLSPCPICSPLEGVVMRLSEAHGLIPRHPNCMCTWIPANVGEDGEDQIDTQSGIERAIRASLEEEGGAEKSSWGGAEAEIDEERPKSIFNAGPEAHPAFDEHFFKLYGYESLGTNEELEKFSTVTNVFCPTGPGGGVDPTCSPGGGEIGEVTTSKMTPNKNFTVAVFRKEQDSDWHEKAMSNPVGVKPPAGMTMRNLVGFATATYQSHRNVHQVGYVEVHPAFRRRGIASAMYDQIEKTSGKPVEKSPLLSEDAQGFWKIRTDNADPLAAFSEAMATINAGDNCGIGPDGFEPGNTCAKGGGGGDKVADIAKGRESVPLSEFGIEGPGDDPPPIAGEGGGGFDFSKVPVKLLNPRDVRSIGDVDDLNAESVSKYASMSSEDTKPLEVIKYKGRHYVADGHHRLAGALIKEELLVKAKVIAVNVAAGSTDNVFCPTGPGGGVDPTCSPERGGGVTVGKQVLTDGLQMVKQVTEQMSGTDGWKHRSVEGLVLAEGTWDRPQELPKGVEWGEEKECYMNAYRLATEHPEKYTYSEGFALISERIPLPIQHAWVVDENGGVVDNTWKTPGVAYVGVHLSDKFVLQQASKTEVYGVFGGAHRGESRKIMQNGLPSGAKEESLAGNYDPDQPRDEDGKWSSSDGGGSVVVKSPSAGRQRFVGNPVNPTAKDTQQAYKQPDGAYAPERRALHDALVTEILSKSTPVERPIAYLLGGGPGAGKTTLINSGGVELPENLSMVAGDEIKTKLPEYQKGLAEKDGMVASFVHEESTDVSASALRQAIATGRNVVLDGTGDSGLDKLRAKVDAMRSSGHRVVAHYVTVPTDVAVARAEARQAKTGRGLPESVIRENHVGVSKVFPKALVGRLYDEATLWDSNREGPPVKVLSHKDGRTIVYEPVLYEEFLRKDPDYQPK